MNKQEKDETLKELKNSLQGATSVVVTDYKGLKVSEVTELRRRLTQKQVHFRVVKNTLAKLGFQETGLKELVPHLKESTAIAYTDGDAVACAKILVDFNKSHENLKLKGGWLTGKIISKEEVKELAMLPGREVLLARVAGGVQAPIAGFVRVLAGPLTKLVRALEEVRKKKA